jgi:hypothetical protein
MGNTGPCTTTISDLLCVYYIILESPILTMILFPTSPVATKESDFSYALLRKAFLYLVYSYAELNVCDVIIKLTPLLTTNT